MESSGKKKTCNENIVDRISTLPDGILQHILSFLETSTAAKSSVLSKRWRHLWVDAPALDFNLNPVSMRRIHRASLRRKSSTLRRLRLRIDDHTIVSSSGAIDQLLNELVDFSMPSQIQELHLVFRHLIYYDATYKLPRYVLPSGNLRTLELGHCDIRYVGAMNLSRVETLSLTGVDAASAEEIVLLISSCVSVKKLRYVSCHKVRNLDLCFRELRELVLESRGKLRNLNIDAPKLQSVELKFDGDDFELSLKNVLNLQRAVLGHGLHYCCYANSNCIPQFKKLFCELGIAKVLELRCDLARVPLDLFENSPPCHNVKKLVVSVLQRASSVISILKLFPNLEDFTFECKDKDKYQSEFKNVTEELKDVSVYCLKHSLKRIELRNFNDCRNPVTLAKFLVQNAVVLEKMLLTEWNGRFVRNLELLRFLMESKASKVATIMST